MLHYLAQKLVLDNLLDINNIYFAQVVHPAELQLNKYNSSDTEAPFLYFYVSICNGIVSTKVYDKQDDFYFDIDTFPFLNGGIPQHSS